MSDYEQFLASKLAVAPTVGIDKVYALSEKLFPFQRDIVGLALRRGRSAIFADTGLGKGLMAMEWLRVVAEHTEKPVLLLAPLAVSHQFVREAKKFNEQIRIVSDQSEVGPGINVTNYHKLHKFDPTLFSGVAIDEAAILKSFDGKYRTDMINAFAQTPYKLALTATPAPNDYMELGNYAEFFGIMSRVEMLSMFFVHDGETTQEWRLKGHAEGAFWRWVASWAVTLRKPSDLGYDNTGYDLPPLNYEHHVLPVDQDEVFASGQLFAASAATLADQRVVRRATLNKRVEKCAEIANSTSGSVIVWTDLNDEGDSCEKAIPDAVQVAGRHSDDEKEERINSFTEGNARVLVSKSVLCGWGLNWQHCNTIIFCGITNSFESFYQAIRRCWRFGQTKPVTVHIVTSESEGRVIENLKRKHADADRMADAMVAAMAENIKLELGATARTFDEYAPTQPIIIPDWITSEAA